MSKNAVLGSLAGTLVILGVLILLLVHPRREALEGPKVGDLEARLDSLERDLEKRLAGIEERIEARERRAAEVSSAPEDDRDAEAPRPEASGTDPDSAKTALLEERLEALEAQVKGLEGDPIARGHEYLSSKSADVRRQGIKMLRKLARKDPESRKAVRGMLGDPDPRVRAEAIDGVKDFDDRESIPQILSLLADPDPGVRREAVQALGSLKDPQAASALQAFYDQGAGNLSLSTALALRKLGRPQAFEVEMGRLSQLAQGSQDERVRIDAIRILGKYAPEKSQDIFNQALNDPSPRVRKAAEKFMRK